MRLVLQTSSEEETGFLGYELGDCLFHGALVLLNGELGTGKTAFARGIARGIGVSGIVNSPTFTILSVYQGRLPLYHFDLYRIEDEDELFELGMEEFLDGDGVTVVEWAEKFTDYFPQEALSINICRESDNCRIFELWAGSAEYEKILLQLSESWGN